MGSISIGLALDQGQGGRPPARLVFSDIAPGMAIPLPVGLDSVRVRIESLDVYSGNYWVQTNLLSSGPAAIVAPQIAQDPESGTLSVSLPGLWAHGETGGAPVATYRWQRDGTDISGATGAQYTPGPDDAGQTLRVVETATDAAGARSQNSNGIVDDSAPWVPASVTITGLTNGDALPGSHAGIGYTIDPDRGIETVKWSGSPDPSAAAAYGTGASPTDYTSGDGGVLYLHVAEGGTTVTQSAPIRHAAGTAPAIGAQSWTVDDDVVSLDAGASGANLVFSHAATGLPGNAQIDAGTGEITVSGNGGAFVQGDAATGSISITATDQYGRNSAYTVPYTISLRAQATAAGALTDPVWPAGAPVNLDLTGDFIANGNTLTYAITGLPAGLADDGDGSLSGTPSVESQSGSVTITAADEYGRATPSAFSYSVSAAITATIDGLTVNPEHGLSAQDGVELSYAVSNLPAGITATGQSWRVGDVEPTTEIGALAAVTPDTATNDAEDLFVRVFLSNGQVIESQRFTIRNPYPVFSVQPSISGTPQVGQTLALDTGTAAPGATYERSTLTLDGVGKAGEIAGGQWDTTGENVYGTDGLVAYRVTASSSGGTVLSDVISATLTDVPDRPAVTGFDLVDNGDTTYDIILTSLPDNGNSAITAIQYSDDGGANWRALPAYAGAGVYPIDVRSDGVTATAAADYNVALRAVNAVGNGTASQTKAITVTGPVGTITVTAPGSVDGEFRVGSLRTITPGTVEAGGTGGTISFEYRFLVDGVTNSDTASYTHVAEDDGLTCTIQWRGVETGGTSPGETAWQTVGFGTVSYGLDTVITQAVLSGPAEAGGTVSLTTAAYGRNTGTRIDRIETSADGVSGWSDTGTGLTRIAVQDEYLRGFCSKTDSGGTVTSITAVLGPVAAASAPFSADLQSDGTIEIAGNDGRDFVVDDALDRYDGTYSIAAGSLANGPVALVDVALNGTGEVGRTLDIIPALFAFDTDFGPVSISYATNGANAVDVTDPDNPRLVVDAADAGTTLTVTATATQGANTTDSVSVGMAIPAVAGAGPQVAAIDIQQDTTTTDTPAFTIDLSGYGSGDLVYIAYGLTDGVSSITVGGTEPALLHTNAGGGSGTRIRVYEHVMTGPGGPTTISVTTSSATRNDHIIAVAGVRGGVRGNLSADGATTARTTALERITATVTPAGANNAILAFALGRREMFGAHVWTGAAQLSEFSGATSGAALAVATNVAVAAYDISFDGDASAPATDDRAVIASIAFTGV